MNHPALPPVKQGLYDPRHEHDACGLGFIAHINGHKSHDIITQGLQILKNLTHRGATGADPLHLALVFNIDHTNAMTYANAARNLPTDPAGQELSPHRPA